MQSRSPFVQSANACAPERTDELQNESTGRHTLDRIRVDTVIRRYTALHAAPERHSKTTY